MQNKTRPHHYESIESGADNLVYGKIILEISKIYIQDMTRESRPIKLGIVKAPSIENI